MKTLFYLLLPLILAGCKQGDETTPASEKTSDLPPRPSGVFYYDESVKGKHVADFREPDILRYEFIPLPGSGLDPMLKIYKWHVEDDLIITEESKTSRTRAVMSPQIFRFDSTGTLWTVGWTDKKGRHIDGPDEVYNSTRWHKKQ